MRPRRNVHLTAALLLVIGILISACATGEDDEGTGDKNTPIVIGGTLGLSGVYATSSAAYRAAYDFWVADVNKNGGLLGRKVKLVVYDDESNPTTAQQLYQKLINEDDADLLLAPYATAVGGAIVPITERAGKILWNGGFVSQELHARNKLIVNSYPYQDTQYALPLFEYFKSLPSNQRPKTLAIVTAQNPFPLAVRAGYDGKDGVLNYAKQLGIKVVFDEEYEQTASDVNGLIQRAKAKDPDAFIQLSLPDDAALLAKTAHEQDFRPRFYCSCGSQVTTLPTWGELGAAGSGVMATTTAWPTQGYPMQRELFSMLEKKFDYEEMPAYGAVALAILQVMQQAVNGAKTLDQQKIRDYMEGKTFRTAVGNISYNADGTIKFGALLVQYQKDHNEVIWPKRDATGRAIVPAS